MSRSIVVDMNAIEPFFVLVERYCAETGCAEATLATRMLGDGKGIISIRNGADIGVRRLRRAVEWFSENWPVGVDWPAGIDRPARAVPELAS